MAIHCRTAVTKRGLFKWWQHKGFCKTDNWGSCYGDIIFKAGHKGWGIKQDECLLTMTFFNVYFAVLRSTKWGQHRLLFVAYFLPNIPRAHIFFKHSFMSSAWQKLQHAKIASKYTCSATLVQRAASVVFRLSHLVPPAVTGRWVSPTADSAVSSSSLPCFNRGHVMAVTCLHQRSFPQSAAPLLTALAARLVPFLACSINSISVALCGGTECRVPVQLGCDMRPGCCRRMWNALFFTVWGHFGSAVR